METKETTFINATPDQLAGIRKALDLYTEAAIKVEVFLTLARAR